MTKPHDPLLRLDDLIRCPECRTFAGVYKLTNDTEYMAQCRKCRRVLVNRYDTRGYVVKTAKGTNDAETD